MFDMRALFWCYGDVSDPFNYNIHHTLLYSQKTYKIPGHYAICSGQFLRHPGCIDFLFIVSRLSPNYLLICKYLPSCFDRINPLISDEQDLAQRPEGKVWVEKDDQADSHFHGLSGPSN
jgi:hypothetical protein